MYVGTGDRNPTDEEVHQYLLKKTRGPDRLTASGEETSLIEELDELSRKRNELINSLGEDRAAQRDAIRGLETTLRSPSLLPDVRSALEGRLEQSQKEIKKLEEEWHAQQAREEVFITDFIPSRDKPKESPPPSPPMRVQSQSVREGDLVGTSEIYSNGFQVITMRGRDGHREIREVAPDGSYRVKITAPDRERREQRSLPDGRVETRIIREVDHTIVEERGYSVDGQLVATVSDPTKEEAPPRTVTDTGEYKETRTGNRTEQVYRDGHRVVTEVAGDGSSTITDYPADKPVVKQNDAGEAVTTFERVEEPIRITKIRSDGTIASQQRFPTPEEKGAQEEKRKAGAKRDRELAEREEAEIKRQIPQLAVRAAPLARSGVEQAVLDTPLDHAFVLGDEISSLQGHLRRQEGVVEDNRRRANRARNQGDTAQRNAYLAAADGAETKAQQLR